MISVKDAEFYKTLKTQQKVEGDVSVAIDTF